MKILSIESSSKTCGVALSENGLLLGEYSLFTGNLHDKMLAELTKRLLNDFNLSVNDLDAVAVSAGPGSYTGLRIGASFAKALCCNEKPKLIAIPNLQAFAGASDEFAKCQNAIAIVSVIHSHKDLYYYQTFDLDLNPLVEIQFLAKEIILATVNNSKDKLVYSGNLIEGLNIPTLSGLNRHSPRFISRLATKYYKEEKFVNSNEFIPLYVQEFEVKSSN